MFLFGESLPLSALQLIINGLLAAAEIATHIIVVWQSYATRTQQTNIVRNANAIEELLANAGDRRPTKSMDRRLLIKTWMLLSTVIGTIVIEIVFLSFFYQDYFVTYIAQHVFPTLVNRIRCVQNVFYVDMMSEQLDGVVQCMQTIIDRDSVAPSEKRKAQSILLYPDKGGWLKKQYHPKVSNSKAKNQICELRALKAAYSKIWETNCLINECFGWSLLAIVTEYFVHLTSNGYWLYMVFAQLITAELLVESLSDVGSVLFLMVALCQSCYACSEKVL